MMRLSDNVTSGAPKDINRHSMFPAYDTSTLTWDGVGESLDISAEMAIGIPNHMYITWAGIHVYVLSSAEDFYHYTLETAWGLATASYQSTLSLAIGESSVGFAVSSLGDKLLFASTNGGNHIEEYQLS